MESQAGIVIQTHYSSTGELAKPFLSLTNMINKYTNKLLMMYFISNYFYSRPRTIG